MYRALTRTLRSTRSLAHTRTIRPLHSAVPTLLSSGKDTLDATGPAVDDHEPLEPENLLRGKRTRETIRSALASRAADAVRYEYFAQRAELEAETDAAAIFRGLTETAKQQAMGFMELLEEYGDADFGSTLDNLEVAADGERANAETVFRENGAAAAEEELEQVEEYFEDMAEAAEKAATRLELVGSMLDMEGMDADDVDAEYDDVPEKAKN